ncbi:MAG: 4-alpha-glucanotransferase, partial [Bacteroidota bacterium]
TGEPPATLTPDIAERILIRNLETNSLLCIFQIQDLFILDPDLLMEDASEERINIPGTVGDHNWSYRLPTTLEALTEEHADFTSTVQRLVRTHRTAAPRPEATSQEAARPV